MDVLGTAIKHNEVIIAIHFFFTLNILLDLLSKLAKITHYKNGTFLTNYFNKNGLNPFYFLFHFFHRRIFKD